MPPFRLPVIDPEILILTMAGGALLGALAAGTSLVVNQWARETGSRDAVFPEVAGLLEHQDESNGAAT